MRHVGSWVEWTCIACGCVMQSHDRPADPTCNGCRGLSDAAAAWKRLAAENAALRTELARLARENAEQQDHIFELQQIAKRAHCEADTDPPPSGVAA